MARRESSDNVCQTLDAAASFKSDMWKNFGLSRNETGEKVTDRQQTICFWSKTKTHPWHFVTSFVQSPAVIY